MATTTIRLEKSLRARVAAAAERAGKTSHAFIVEAIVDTVDKLELEEAFHRLADERWAQILATGKTIASAEVRGYLEARALGKRVARPKARQPKS